MRDTIFALATAPGRGAIAVVRVSGPGSAAVLGAVTGRPPPAPRRAALRELRSALGEVLDEALVLWMPGPASFTGEDSVELQLHGGPAIVEAVSEAVAAAGARLAEPGEFTRRAFENGRLDLTQAEAIADLVDAETSAQRRQALGQLNGGLSRRYEDWRERLLDALACLEAEMDFPDEEETGGAGSGSTAVWRAVAEEMRDALGDLSGERVREGYRVALVGAPNVGKSSLLNALVGRDAAIVTQIPGTTRDVVEQTITLAGRAIRLADTAGLRETDDVIEAEGVRRARLWADTADVRVGVVDRSRPDTLGEATAMLRPGDILALNKTDLGAGSIALPEGITAVATVATVDGAAPLKAALEAWLGRDGEREFPAITRLRHRVLLQEALDQLQLNNTHLPAELKAENVRLALRRLERVVGRTNPEAVLDRVFAAFCLGK